MKTNLHILYYLAFSCLLVINTDNASPATQTPSRYTLLAESILIEDCPICGRPNIPLPLRGSFNLKIEQETPISTLYSLNDIKFYAGSPSDPDFLLTGSGTWEISGEVARLQHVTMNLNIWKKYGTNRVLTFTNTDFTLKASFPMLQADLQQTEPDLLQFYLLTIKAAPLYEIWFSTVSGFTSAKTNLSGSGGDILSSTGRIVKSKADLVRKLNLTTPLDQVNIDALDIAPGGEICFSFDRAVNSSTLGKIEEGYLVSDAGRILVTDTQLLNNFGFMPPTPSLGLDAIHFLSTDEVLFSTRNDAFSEKLGQFVRNGDILSSSGYIYKTGKDLLAPFQPSDPNIDYGLDALYVFKNGEVWFSTQTGFNSQRFGSIQAGDLLSDKGYVVSKNLDLLSAFSPLEDLADFGLDAVYIITDFITPVTPPPVIYNVKLLTNALTLQWHGDGSYFRIEWSENPDGPFEPMDFITETSVTIPIPFQNKTNAFFRVRQW